MKHSESLAKIAPALVAFQRDIRNPANSAVNPYYSSKYAPLPDILNHIRPGLAAAKLAVVQSTVGDGATAGVVTMVLHESGEFIESDPVSLPIAPRKDKKTGESYVDAQGAGSAVTYARRYSLCAALGIASDDDDDANAASHGKSEAKPEGAKKPVEDFSDISFGKTEDMKPVSGATLKGTPEEIKAFQSLCDRIDEAKTIEELEFLVPKCKEIAGTLKGNLRVVFDGKRSRILKGDKR